MLVCTPGSTPHPTVASNGRSLHRLVVFLCISQTSKVGFLWNLARVSKIGLPCAHWSLIYPAGPPKN